MTETTEPRSVFVYGTLRPGEPNAYLVEWWQPEVEPGHLPGFALVGDGAGFPYCIPGDEADGTYGDLLTFDAACWPFVLDDLDLLEGNGRHYQRQVVEVERVDADDTMTAWVYVPLAVEHVRADYRPVPGNDWSLRTRHFLPTYS